MFSHIIKGIEFGTSEYMKSSTFELRSVAACDNRSYLPDHCCKAGHRISPMCRGTSRCLLLHWHNLLFCCQCLAKSVKNATVLRKKFNLIGCYDQNLYFNDLKFVEAVQFKVGSLTLWKERH